MILALLVVVLTLAACGGKGGGSDSRSTIKARFSTYWSDLEAQRWDITVRNFSRNYWNNGYGFYDIQDMFQTWFSMSDLSIDVTDRFIGTIYLYDDDLAEVEGSYVIRFRQYGETETEYIEGPFYLIRENGRWLFYGNGSNGYAPKSPKGKALPKVELGAMGVKRLR
jgi:hypothetical protein